jgi:hypothetical protein
MKKFLILILIFLPFILFAQLENTDDLVKQYNQEKLTIVETEKKAYTDRINEDVIVEDIKIKYNFMILDANNQTVKLSEIARRMNNTLLYKNLRWGEAHRGIVSGMITSILSLVALDLPGIIIMCLAYPYYQSVDPDDLITGQNLLISGGIMLGISGISIVGIIALAPCLIKARKNRLNYAQATSLINQYNNSIKKKIGIPIDLELNFIPKKSIGLEFCFKF